MATTYQQVTKPNLWQEEQAGNCLKFTFLAFGGRNGRGFSESRKAWDGQSRRHPGTYPPKGISVPVWFDWVGTVNGIRKNWGHTAVRLPDGRVMSSPYSGFGQLVFASIKALEKGFGATYLGWSEWMDGTVVVQPVEAAVKPVKPARRQYQIVTAEEANVRRRPTTQSPVIRVLKRGTKRRVSTRTRGEMTRGSNTWIRVRTGLRIGWVHASVWRVSDAATIKRLKELK